MKELPLPPVMVREGERLVMQIDGECLQVTAIQLQPPASRVAPGPWPSTRIAISAAQRSPQEAAVFIRQDLDRALAELRRT